jgi:hypothetical protein
LFAPALKLHACNSSSLTLKEHHLNTQLLRDLLSAFRQDVSQLRYASYDELLDYCTRSANPVGRIMLALSDQYSPQWLEQSDAICSALQLINFLQDVAIDIKKLRIIYTTIFLNCLFKNQKIHLTRFYLCFSNRKICPISGKRINWKKSKFAP